MYLVLDVNVEHSVLSFVPEQSDNLLSSSTHCSLSA